MEATTVIGSVAVAVCLPLVAVSVTFEVTAALGVPLIELPLIASPAGTPIEVQAYLPFLPVDATGAPYAVPTCPRGSDGDRDGRQRRRCRRHGDRQVFDIVEPIAAVTVAVPAAEPVLNNPLVKSMSPSPITMNTGVPVQFCAEAAIVSVLPVCTEAPRKR